MTNHKHALIIEDDITSINVLEQLLKLMGIETTVMIDSETITSDLLNITTPDIVFLDLEMTQHNGYLLMEALQKNPHLKDVPVVAYTTHNSHLNNAKRAGFHSFLGKPLDSRRFADQVKAILKGEPVWEVG